MEINRLSLVRKRALKLYKKYTLSVPVDLDYIIKQKNIRILYKENQHGIDGLTRIQKSPPIIEINTEIDYGPRRRFTLAHELGHICIPWHTGVTLCSLDDPSYRIQGQRMINTQELEANTFASELLMPTQWIQENFQLCEFGFKETVAEIARQAKTSIMACFYALENALPSGHVYLVKTQNMEYWKPFKSKDSGTINVSIVNNIAFYDEICVRKENFQLSLYEGIHYELLPCPDLESIQSIYAACNNDFELFLNAISNFNPIHVVHFIDIILEHISDKFYLVLKIGDVLFRHIRSKDTSIRLHEEYNNFNALADYARQNFFDSGILELGEYSYLLWIKDSYRYKENKTKYMDPLSLLKRIIEEVYWYDADLAHKMLMKVNGVIGSLNGLNKDKSREELYHLIKQRFVTDNEYDELTSHELFDTYISNKLTDLINKRR